MGFSLTQKKIIGEVLLLIPEALLLILGLGEISGGIISGIQHFLQLAPLLILSVLAWFYPKIIGVLLLAITFILAILYFFYFAQGFPIAAILINTLLLFGTSFFAGIIFISAKS